jgi:hypothetical protein
MKWIIVMKIANALFSHGNDVDMLKMGTAAEILLGMKSFKITNSMEKSSLRS